MIRESVFKYGPNMESEIEHNSMLKRCVIMHTPLPLSPLLPLKLPSDLGAIENLSIRCEGCLVLGPIVWTHCEAQMAAQEASGVMAAAMLWQQGEHH